MKPPGISVQPVQTLIYWHAYLIFVDEQISCVINDTRKTTIIHSKIMNKPLIIPLRKHYANRCQKKFEIQKYFSPVHGDCKLYIVKLSQRQIITILAIIHVA